MGISKPRIYNRHVIFYKLCCVLLEFIFQALERKTPIEFA
ncbi:hypothetical protein APHMUC_0790 [Anaplasma phagocytophilum str. ApMUC09]|uniref:Uncharacterized protein n=1 Tax=Anaplasma phagocytophilum str. ApMUC09 TaxID=1359152 RepID=A0A0F3N9C0_ANAPH|nr:hypothetical protein APHMUC_0790 [Anaplasma phagocytophilum str. ApMUC09]